MERNTTTPLRNLKKWWSWIVLLALCTAYLHYWTWLVILQLVGTGFLLRREFNREPVLYIQKYIIGLLVRLASVFFKAFLVLRSFMISSAALPRSLCYTRFETNLPYALGKVTPSTWCHHFSKQTSNFAGFNNATSEHSKTINSPATIS